MTTVLHVAEQLDWFGGTPRKLLSLFRHAATSDAEHHILVFFRGTLDSEFVANGAELRVVQSARPGDVTRGIVRMAADVGADVISTHFTRALVCATVGQPLHRRPIVHNEHGSADIGSRGTIQARISHTVRRWCLKRTQAVFCNSQYTSDAVREAFGVNPERMKVIYNPVSARESGHRVPDEQHYGVPPAPGTIRLGHIGGMIPVRDQGTLLRAAAQLKSSGLSVHVTMAGDGPCRAALEDAACKLGLDQDVRFVGYVDDVGDLLAHIDVYVNTTVSEGFGIAVAEAMLAEVPVVLADAGAHRELIEPGRSGLLFDAGNAQSLVQQILRLWEDPATARRMAVAARARGLDLFCPSKFSKQYAALMRETLAR